MQPPTLSANRWLLIEKKSFFFYVTAYGVPKGPRKNFKMGRYKDYENLPWWLNNLNDDTLTPAQKQVLNLDYYCKKFGTKLSHKKAAQKLQRGRHTIYTARRRLEELMLRSTLPAKGSFKLGYPLEYQNEAEWLTVLRTRGIDPQRFKMKRKSVQKKRPLRGLSSSQVQNEASAETAEARVSLPQSPAGLTNRCSGETVDSVPTREFRNACLRKVVYQGALNKLLDAGWSQEKAERFAKIKTDATIAKRNDERKIE